MAKTHSIDAEQKKVITDIGELHYDKLVIATGATSNFFGLKNIEKYGMPMKSLTEALNLRSLIIQNFEEALNTSDLLERERLMNFVIVGAGATGVEIAGALAELKAQVLVSDYPDLDVRRMQIHIVEAGDKVLGNMSAYASRKSTYYLRKRGINIWFNTIVEDYDGRVVKCNTQNFETNTLIWAAGISGQSPDGLAVEKSKSNRLITDTFNRVNGFIEVYAIGDIAQMESEQTPRGHPMLASVAEQQGGVLAVNFNRESQGTQMKPFVYINRGTMATIGRNKAVVDLQFIKYGGFVGWLTWMFVHLMLLVDFRSRIVVFVNWVWSYIFLDKGTRLIINKYKRK